MARSVEIGTWHENERDIQRCPSYYAADWEVLHTHSGDYPLSVEFVEGYMVPMPYWIDATIDTERTDGRLYSGMGGNNFASRPLTKEPRPYHLRLYAYYLAELIADGRVTLHDGFDWLLAERPWADDGAPKTWPEVIALTEHR